MTKSMTPGSAGNDTAEKAHDTSAPSKPTNRLKQLTKNKKLISILIILLVFVAIASTLFVLRNDDKTDSDSTQNYRGEAYALVSGNAEISEDGQNWSAITENTPLNVGYSVRTPKDGRAILTFNEQSVVRLNYSTTVQLVTLNDTTISMQQTQGEAYHRFISSSEATAEYTVTMPGAIFNAKGTAFKTLITSSKKSLEVYEGSVEASINSKTQTVKLGYGLYSKTSDDTSAFALKKLSPSQVQKNQFVLWNLARDKRNPNFKDRLGFLAKLSSSPQDLNLLANDETKQISSAASIKLYGKATSDNKLLLSWKVSGLPKDTSFALSFSRETNKPNSTHDTNQEQDVNSVRVTEGGSFTWSYPDGKTVWLSLCAYDSDDYFGGGQVVNCFKTSNVITYNAPYVADKIVQPGDVQLTADGIVLSWTHAGTAPFGYRVVYLSEYDSTWKTSSTSMNVEKPQSYPYSFYVCKEGYYELVDCSNTARIDSSQTP